MTTNTANIPETDPARVNTAASESPLGVNEVRLSARQWLAAMAILVACVLAIPRIWKRIERFETGPDCRIAYDLSKDYWLYQRRLEAIADPASVPVLGDSVIWGEYVRPDGTLSHFLNRETGSSTPKGTQGVPGPIFGATTQRVVPESGQSPARFFNCGVNGLFPLALEGLVEHYGSALRDRKVIVHCNLLWMTSPKADLSTRKKEEFNHSRLVPQFFPQAPPCYQADAGERLGAAIERNVGFLAWVDHVNDVYFGQQSIPRWTLAEDESDPPRPCNAWRNPLAQIELAVPGDPADDPLRGPASPRHKPWTQSDPKDKPSLDSKPRPVRFDWVDLEASLQWRAFRRLIALLERRGYDVLVLLGPFNEHLVAEEQRPTVRGLRDGIAAWLAENRVACVVPETLPSSLYADASHPLTEGYALLAKRIAADAAFRKWLASGK